MTERCANLNCEFFTTNEHNHCSKPNFTDFVDCPDRIKHPPGKPLTVCVECSQCGESDFKELKPEKPEIDTKYNPCSGCEKLLKTVEPAPKQDVTGQDVILGVVKNILAMNIGERYRKGLCSDAKQESLIAGYQDMLQLVVFLKKEIIAKGWDK